MYILFTDETNLNPQKNAKFFIYGGLIFDIDCIADITKTISEIRTKYKFKKTDDLKFDTRSRPKHISIEDFIKAKEEVIKVCIDFKCKFIVYVVLHDIIKNVTQKDIIHKGADHVIGKFNYFLSTKNSFGLVFVDRLSDTTEYPYLSSKFTKGLCFSGGETVELDRILIFSSTCNNASHLSTAVDIVLGSFRYCINSPKNIDIAKELMNKVTTMIWHTKIGKDIDAFEKGLIFRPQSIRIQKYKDEYDTLLQQINYLIDTYGNNNAC